MTDTPLDIDAECRQLQEHLRQLTRDREVIFRKFEELTISNRRLIREIEDDDEATFENLGKFEEEKRSLEDKLEALERSLKEKNESIAALDAKVSEYLLQVSTQSNLKADEIERVTGEVAAHVQSEKMVASETSIVRGELDTGRGEGQGQSLESNQMQKKEDVQVAASTQHHDVEKDAALEESTETKVGTSVSTLKEAAAEAVCKGDPDIVVETGFGAVQEGSVCVMGEPGDGTVIETADITAPKIAAETLQEVAASTVKEAVASTVPGTATIEEQEATTISIQEKPGGPVQEVIKDLVVTATVSKTQEATSDVALKASIDSTQEIAAGTKQEVSAVTVLADGSTPEPKAVVQSVRHDDSLEVAPQQTVSEAAERVSSEEIKTAIAPSGQDVATKTRKVPTGELNDKPTGAQTSVNSDRIETDEREDVNQGVNKVIVKKGAATIQETAGSVIDRQTKGGKAVKSKAEYESTPSTLPGLPCSDEVKLSGKGEEESAVKSLVREVEDTDSLHEMGEREKQPLAQSGEASKTKDDEQTDVLVSPDIAPSGKVIDVSLVLDGKESTMELDQVASLSALVSELKRVKEDMSKCMTVKETSFIELEDQLLKTKEEMAVLKQSLAKMTEDMQDKVKDYETLMKDNRQKVADIESKKIDIQNMNDKCFSLENEKSEILRKLEVLEIMMTEYRTEIETLVEEKNTLEKKADTLAANQEKGIKATTVLATTQETSDEVPHESPLNTQNQSDLESENIDVGQGDSDSPVVETEIPKPKPAYISEPSTASEPAKAPEESSAPEPTVIPKSPPVTVPVSAPAETPEVDPAPADAGESQGVKDSEDSNEDEDQKEVDAFTQKIHELEKHSKDLNSKLKVAHKQIKVMHREREYKQKECEILQRKVEKVELKMCELQGTFDVLMKAIMAERDDLLKEVEQKSKEIESLNNALKECKESFERQISSLVNEKSAVEHERDRYKSGELLSDAVALDKASREAVEKERDLFKEDLKSKIGEAENLEKKLAQVQKDMDDFVICLKEEKDRWLEEAEKSKKQKESVEELFSSLQKEHVEVSERNEVLEKSFKKLENMIKEKDSSLESYKLQQEDLQQQLEDLNTKNFNLTSEMYTKEEELKEELAAREATIQELNTTLVNNQKQSMENYHAVQEDMQAIEQKFKQLEETSHQSKEELKKIKESNEEKDVQIKGLKEKIIAYQESALQSNAVLELNSSSQSPDTETEEDQGIRRVVTRSSGGVAIACASSGDTEFDKKGPNGSDSIAVNIIPVDFNKQIEDLQKREKELLELVEHNNEKSAEQILELKALVDPNVYDMKQKIIQLENELRNAKIVNEEREKASTAFKSQEEFEKIIKEKEAKLVELDGRVNDLELCLASKSTYILELEERLESNEKKSDKAEEEIANIKREVECHISEITKLNGDISRLREELEQMYVEYSSLKEKVEKLEFEKQQCEKEKEKIIAEYEAKLQQANGCIENMGADVEEKKNLVESLKLELSHKDSSHCEKLMKLELNHVEVVSKLNENLFRIRDDNEKKFQELEKQVISLKDEKHALEEELEQITVKHEEIKKEISTEHEDQITGLQTKIDKLQQEKFTYEEEKQKLRDDFEEQQTMALTMQNEMVADLEKLILSLENEKKNLQEELNSLKEKNENLNSSYRSTDEELTGTKKKLDDVEKENETLIEFKKDFESKLIFLTNELREKVMDYQKSQNQLEELNKKLDDYNSVFEEQEQIYSGKLKEEKEIHLAQYKSFREEMLHEMDIISQRKDELSLEYEDKICTIEKEYEERLNATRERYEIQMMEDKADFGRVLVAKIDEYENQLQEKNWDIEALSVQLHHLQGNLDDKVNLIETLECNLSDMNLLRMNLESQVEDLKFKLSKMESIDELRSEYKDKMDILRHNLKEEYEGKVCALKAEYSLSCANEIEQLCSEHETKMADLQAQADQKYAKLQMEAEAKIEDLKIACESDISKVAVSNAETTLVGLQKQLDTSESKSVELKQKLENTLTKNKDLTTELETLTVANEELASRIKSVDISSDDTAKKIAMLEFNNEHNKNKVKNMEISNDELKQRIGTLQKEKEDLHTQLRERISVVEEQITKEKSEALERVTKERDEVLQTLTQEKKELEERLLRVKTDVEESYNKEKKQMVGDIEGLTEIKISLEKQVAQIEQNNSEMHRKIGEVQVLRDKFKALAEKTQSEKDVLQREYDQLKTAREELDVKVSTLKGELEVLQKKVEEEFKEKQNLQENKATLQHNLTNLQQQVQGLEQTNRKLKTDLIALTTAKQELESLVAQQKKTMKTLEDSVSEKEQKLEVALKENKELMMKVADLNDASKLTEVSSGIEKKSAESQISADEHLDGMQSKDSEYLLATLATVKTECKNAKDEVKQKVEEIAKANDQLKKLQEKLRVEEVISGEVEDYRRKIRGLESQIVSMEESHRDQLKSVAKECETRIAAKEQDCQNTLSSAYDQQDSVTGALVRQHRELLKEAQEESQEKASALDALKHEHQNKMKEKDEELCRFVQQYEDQLSSLKTQHEAHIREVEQLWKQRAEKIVQQREKTLQEEMDGLTQEWNKERRELERLTQVAAAAFRSGSDSVELLKKQVAAQRRELEEVKINHRKEMRELQQLLEIKRRSGKSSTGLKLGVALEEAAEFEYLKNVLYQYMMGKEKQTLAKVLCAVVKFDAHQEQQILEHEEQQNSLLGSWSHGLGL